MGEMIAVVTKQKRCRVGKEGRYLYPNREILFCKDRVLNWNKENVKREKNTIDELYIGELRMTLAVIS